MASLRSGLQNRASLGELIRTLPARQLMLLWLAIFSTFTSIPFMIDIIVGGRLPIAWLLSMGIVSGGLSVGFTATSLRRRWMAFASLIAVDIVYILVARRVFQLQTVAPPGRLVWDAIGTLVVISVGSTLFVLFMNVTATQHLHAQAELAVAHEMHRVLVPSRPHHRRVRVPGMVDRERGGGRRPGRSRRGRWSLVGVHRRCIGPWGRRRNGHGHVQERASHTGARRRLRCGSAWGHPNGTTPQLALGMFADARFTSAQVECRAGDLLALLTDGLIEVFDTANRELGFEWAKTVLGELAERPLKEIADRLLAGARNHGAQLDDQSVLLIRRGTLARHA